MRPGPATGSPPDTDQVTRAALPLLSVAAKRWTGRPRGLAPLQPLQLVSMAAAPGEMAKTALPGLAATVGDAQPASAMKKGAISSEPVISTILRRPMHMGDRRAGFRVLRCKVPTFWCSRQKAGARKFNAIAGSAAQAARTGLES